MVGVFSLMTTKLHVVALTGGIATGKSTCCRFIKDILPETLFFDADLCVARLYSSSEVIQELKSYFGAKVIHESGAVNKTYLRGRAFTYTEDKLFLEQVFHPRVMKECLALLAESTRNASSRLFVADIPLLFEGGFDLGQSMNLLLATSRETQVKRLKIRNAWDDDTVDSVLKSQMPIEAKFTLADVIIWNEGPLEILHSQIQRFIQEMIPVE